MNPVFVKKEWKKRVVEYPGRRRLEDTARPEIYDVSRAEGNIIQEGDGFTVENMNGIEERVGDAFDKITPFYGAYENFPEVGEPNKTYIDDTVDPRLMYTWDTETQKYILTGGAGGADGGSVDIPITLTSADWTGASAPYSQTVTVPQMREGMTPLFFLSSEGDNAQYAFSLLTGHQTSYAEITFYAADRPAVDLDLILKGIPAQELEYVDNTVVFLVEPSAFTQNATTQRYEATIPVEGMTEGTGGVWDIVRSGSVLTEEESKIALSITDVDRMEGAVKITCLELPTQRYMMSIAGAYPDAEPGTVILAGMQTWFDRVEALEESLPVSGRYNFTISENSTITSANIPFGNTFKEVPKVFANVIFYGPPGSIEMQILSIEKGGFHARITNNLQYDYDEVYITWIAFGN